MSGSNWRTVRGIAPTALSTTPKSAANLASGGYAPVLTVKGKLLALAKGRRL